MKQIKLDDCVINYQVFFKNNKNVYFKIKDGLVHITCSKTYDITMIEALMHKHKRWILNNYRKKSMDLYAHDYLYYWGLKYKVAYDESQVKPIIFDGSQFILQSKIISKQVIEQFYKIEVLKEINQILIEQSQKLEMLIGIDNISYKAQLMRSRLGSCITSKRIIKLNSILGRLDKVYIHLVLMHELTHLKVPNHSKKFHDLLEKIVPNHKIINRKLKNKVKQFNY